MVRKEGLIAPVMDDTFRARPEHANATPASHLAYRIRLLGGGLVKPYVDFSADEQRMISQIRDAEEYLSSVIPSNRRLQGEVQVAFYGISVDANGLKFGFGDRVLHCSGHYTVGPNTVDAVFYRDDIGPIEKIDQAYHVKGEKMREASYDNLLVRGVILTAGVDIIQYIEATTN